MENWLPGVFTPDKIPRGINDGGRNQEKTRGKRTRRTEEPAGGKLNQCRDKEEGSSTFRRGGLRGKMSHVTFGSGGDPQEVIRGKIRKTETSVKKTARNDRGRIQQARG